MMGMLLNPKAKKRHCSIAAKEKPMTLTSVEITGDRLTIEEVVAIALGKVAVAPLAGATRQKMETTQRWLEAEIQKQDRVFYGINTGFGSHADEVIDPGQAGELSRNVVLSDVSGIGDPLPS
ncbi:MAG: aromatic amino acid lyase [Hormoscilla sp. GM7CHS1pb]|nr:aromatic amino acid lyase [Hormoscilla sp. GM7CHS1pb]